MSTLFLDIETVPLTSSLEMPYPDAERMPPANYKNPEAIQGWREKDRATWSESRVKECSLHSSTRTHRVLGPRCGRRNAGDVDGARGR